MKTNQSYTQNLSNKVQENHIQMHNRSTTETATSAELNHTPLTKKEKKYGPLLSQSPRFDIVDDT